MIRVVICDDEEPMRQLATLLLAEEPDTFDVVAAVATIDDLRATLAARPVDVAVLDLRLPGFDRAEVLDGLRLSCPFVVYSAWAAGLMAAAARNAGAAGYVQKGDTGLLLREAVRRAATPRT